MPCNSIQVASLSCFPLKYSNYSILLECSVEGQECQREVLLLALLASLSSNWIAFGQWPKCCFPLPMSLTWGDYQCLLSCLTGLLELQRLVVGFLWKEKALYKCGSLSSWLFGLGEASLPDLDVSTLLKCACVFLFQDKQLCGWGQPLALPAALLLHRTPHVLCTDVFFLPLLLLPSAEKA